MKPAKILLLIFCLGGGATAWASGGSYRFIAVSLAGSAKSRQKHRVAVIGFSSETGKPSRACAIVTSRLTSEMASRPGLEVIERGRLDEVMQGRRLNANGVLDSRTAKKIGDVLGADAMVTGTVIELDDRKIEVNARLVDTQSGRILKSVTADIRKDWKEESRDSWRDLDFDMDIDMDSPAAMLPADQDESGGCRKLSDQDAAFAKTCIDLRARKTAFDMKTGAMKLNEVTKNPGADIKDAGLKQLYYSRIKEWYYSDQLTQLTAQEEAQLEKGAPMLDKYPCQ